MNRTEIEAAIPHRPPMLLVDSILEQDDNHIVCEKTFHEDEFFFQGHYPGHPIVPGVILCECAMQAGAVLLSQFAKSETGIPVATRLNDVQFRKIIHPGDTIQVAVQLDERLANAFFLTARLSSAKSTVARFHFACTLASIPQPK